MAGSTRQRNVRGQGALLRDEILAAAIRVVDSSASTNEVSLRSIAREAGISNAFDSYVDGAVKRFQARHGLAADGVIGRETLAQLEVSPARRVRQIVLR